MDQTLDRRAIRLWRLHGTFVTLVTLGSCIAWLRMESLFTSQPLLGASLAGFAVLAVGLLGLFALPQLRFRAWRFRVDANELELQHGLWVVTRTLIPLVKIQHVGVLQDPASRWLGLASVAVSTAAGVHTIPGLPLERADELRGRLSRLAREARDAL